jgi:predicted nucleic acid-binding protein
MAKIFLDTNYFIDALHRRPEKELLESLENNVIYISPLSVHIYCYVYKINVKTMSIAEQINKFQQVDLSDDVVTRALQGPTADFEDNVQLHSAADTDCTLFLTADKKLLEMKFFGKVKLANSS